MFSYVGVAVNPPDNGALDNSAARSIDDSAITYVTGDFLILEAAVRDGAASFTITDTGGQTWTPETLRSGSSNSLQRWRAQFNGTWTGDVQIRTATFGTAALILKLEVYRPTSGTNVVAVDVAQVHDGFAAPVAPFDVTATGQTPIAASTLTHATWVSQDDNTWTLQTAGWTNPAGNAQWRNTTGNDLSVSSAYKIQSSAVATGNVTNRQVTNGGDAGRWIISTYKETGSSTVTVSNVEDELFYDGETGIVIDGANFSASGNTVKIASVNNVADASAVTQTITAQGTTQITFTGVLSSFTPFATLYLFVINGSAQSNASGYAVKRESRMRFSDDVTNFDGDLQASLAGLHYRIVKNLNDAEPLLSGTDESTDGSAILTTGYYTLTEGGDLAPGDSVLLLLEKPGAVPEDSVAVAVRVTPTYS